MATKILVAVLDDYHGLAPAHFNKLDGSVYAVDFFPETLRPYNHAETSQEERDKLVKRLEPYEVIATMRERTAFPRDLIDRLPRLRLLLSSGSRNKAIDMEACKARGIPVTATEDAAAISNTVEHIVSLILAVCRNIVPHDTAVKTGKWQTAFVNSLAGKRLGLVGLGRLGASVGRIMKAAFGMEVVAWSANLRQDVADEQAKSQGLPVQGEDGEKTFKAVSRRELFETSDVVSVHLVLSDRSRGLMTKEDLSRMKPSSFFVNTSRGPLVVERDLLDILKAGRIAGAALDVFDIEPLPRDSEWRSLDWGSGGTSQVLLTPHVAFVEEKTMDSFYRQQVGELLLWSGGEPLKRTMY
ncbi:hypothetical protein L249_7645 [Ophiocordyceps polyrhachis-furcata BCC 54312]|uniref:D-isomer specific 2-hydroxyacid dehydrogenase NAD-binding domain-containing protein n=1 Tax=Ophiocordyceps polyrhachis-furcata BCC 54312 TaxID=1330021 RepID=A0A367L9X6_9HYPO|nr:hypothetical protein L249_7645 [Ophiocordyceps polyrhachis-furcata BCC 54312]